MTGFGQNEFLEFDFNPRDWKMSEGGLGEIVSESFDEFTLFGLGGLAKELAKVEIVERLVDVVAICSFFQIGNGNRDGAEEFLRFFSFCWRNAEMAGEFEIHQ